VALAVSSVTTLNGLDFITWRTAFWFGVVVALVGTVARTTLKETPEFADAQKRIKSSLDDSQQKELKNNPMWIQNTKNDKKTFVLLFFLDCGWPVCFYFSYIFCGSILKQKFGFTATEVIHQNFIVSMIQFIGMIILSFISYKIYPPKIIKVKLFVFVLIALISPFLITMTHNPYIIMLIQCCFLLFACDYVPAMPITYKHISVLRRFTYTSMSYALSRSLMSVITSFGLVYLFEYLGYFGLFAIIVPVVIGYTISVNYFDKLEKEAGNYR
jgi:predicted MFS family arabinose efflux permease